MDYLTGDSFGIVLTPETCYQIYLNNMSMVQGELYIPMIEIPVKMGFRTMSELMEHPIEPFDAYYASLSLSVKKKIKVMIKVCQEKKKEFAVRFLKFLRKQFSEGMFKRAIKLNFDFGKPIYDYISFVEHQYSLLMELDQETINYLITMMDMIYKGILLIADEECMNVGPSRILILKRQNDRIRIVPFAAR